MMKKCKKVRVGVIIFALIMMVLTPSTIHAGAKTIYYPGLYVRKYRKGEKLILEMNKYTSSKGKTVGNYKIYHYFVSSGEQELWEVGKLKKSKKNNVYNVGDMTFKVYKKKVVITKSGNMNGTYKLKKRAVRS